MFGFVRVKTLPSPLKFYVVRRIVKVALEGLLQHFTFHTCDRSVNKLTSDVIPEYTDDTLRRYSI